MASDRPSYGGQAVIEGVMMRGPRELAVAVREPGGDIVVERRPITIWTNRFNWQRIPFLRGIAALVESLVLGTWALMYSAEQSGTEQEQMKKSDVYLSMGLALILAVGLFMVLPTFLIGLMRRAATGPAIILNLSEGLLRLGILIGYVAAVSRVKDVARVLEYHGAEHKVIHAFEQGSLDMDTIRRQPTLHPRCGTSFLLFVVVVSVLLFSFFGWPGVIQRIAMRLAFLPVIAAISYELIRFSGRSRALPARIAMYPGLLLQRLSTRQPDDSQIEVALTALTAILPPVEVGTD